MIKSHSALLTTPQLSSDLRRIKLRSRRMVSGDLLGQYRSSFKGTGLVYSDVREYQPGDDVKHIHWKVSARTDKVFVKSYEEEKQLRVMLALDTSASLVGLQNSSTYERLLEFSYLISTLTKRGNDLLGACLFSDDVKMLVHPTSSSHRHHKILSLLSQRQTATQSRNTNVAGALDYLGTALRKPTLIFLASDFFTAPFDSELRKVASRHDIVLVHIEHPISTLPAGGLVTFTDSETGTKILVDSSSTHVRAAWENQRDSKRKAIARVARESGVDVIHLTDSSIAPFAQLMLARAAKGSPR